MEKDRTGNEAKRKNSRILGFALIVFSWIIWAVIFILPFFKLSMKEYAIIYPVLLAATAIFWVGAALVGKEIVQKYDLFSKLKKFIGRSGTKS